MNTLLPPPSTLPLEDLEAFKSIRSSLIAMAKEHKRMDIELSTHHMNLRIDEIGTMKKRLNDHLLEMNKLIRKFEKLGGEFDFERMRSVL